MSVDPSVGDFASRRRAGRRQEDPGGRPEPERRRRRRDRCPWPHRDAGLHRHPPPPVRDGAAQLPGGRTAAGLPGPGRHHAELLRADPVDLCAGVPAAGRLHQRALRLAQPAGCRRDDGARHLADPPLPAAQRRRDPGAEGLGAQSRVRLLRKRRRRARTTSTRPTHGASSSATSAPATNCCRCPWAARSTCRATRRPGRSAASWACRWLRTSSAPSACAASSTSWRRPAPSAPTTSSST